MSARQYIRYAANQGNGGCGVSAMMVSGKFAWAKAYSILRHQALAIFVHLVVSQLDAEGFVG